jgi:hypothetical protein
MSTYRSVVVRLFGVLALVLIPLTALAQQPAGIQQNNSSPHQGFGIGAKVGPLFSSLSEAGSSDALKNRTGIIGGLFMGGNRPGIVGVGVDLLFARKGAKEEVTDASVTLDYLNVPVYLRINGGSSNINRGVIGYGIIGVDLNFLLKSKFSVGDVDNTDDFKRADYGLALGAGVEISRVILEGRYTKGLGSIAKDKDDPELKTQSFAVMVGVRFN